jgi:hypothetical protein
MGEAAYIGHPICDRQLNHSNGLHKEGTRTYNHQIVTVVIHLEKPDCNHSLPRRAIACLEARSLTGAVPR